MQLDPPLRRVTGQLHIHVDDDDGAEDNASGDSAIAAEGEGSSRGSRMQSRIKTTLSKIQASRIFRAVSSSGRTGRSRESSVREPGGPCTSVEELVSSLRTYALVGVPGETVRRIPALSVTSSLGASRDRAGSVLLELDKGEETKEVRVSRQRRCHPLRRGPECKRVSLRAAAVQVVERRTHVMEIWVAAWVLSVLAVAAAELVTLTVYQVRTALPSSSALPRRPRNPRGLLPDTEARGAHVVVLPPPDLVAVHAVLDLTAGELSVRRPIPGPAAVLIPFHAFAPSTGPATACLVASRQVPNALALRAQDTECTGVQHSFASGNRARVPLLVWARRTSGSHGVLSVVAGCQWAFAECASGIARQSTAFHHDGDGCPDDHRPG